MGPKIDPTWSEGAICSPSDPRDLRADKEQTTPSTEMVRKCAMPDIDSQMAINFIIESSDFPVRVMSQFYAVNIVACQQGGVSNEPLRQ